MSIAGIFSSSYSNYTSQNTQNRFQQFQQEFQQLGQDLQSGNISAAQQDFAALQQLSPQSSSTSAQSSNPIAQEFSQLSQALQSGNLSAAQQDYTTIQQDFQNQAAQSNPATEGHHGHHHHHGGGSGESSQASQLFTELGQDLQSNNISAAQQTYNALLQDLPQFSPVASAQQSSSTSVTGVSLTA